MKTCPLNSRQRGISLIEMMIAMLLGLSLIGGTLSIFLSSLSAFRVTENISRLQENLRISFELMAREVREAGGNPCGARQVSNVLANSSTAWWANWGKGAVYGFDTAASGDGAASIVPVGTAAGNRIAGTDSVVLMSGNINEGLGITEHTPASAQFKVSTTSHGIVDGEVLMACDYKSAAIFQVTSASSSNVTVVHNTGGTTPGNCSKGLGYPTLCTTNGTSKSFENGGFLVKLTSSYWYVGKNSRGGNSLFRMTLSGTTTVPEEIASDVQDMQLTYLTADSTGLLATAFRSAGALSANDWNGTASTVVAVQIVLTFQSKDKVGTDQQAIQRQLLTVIHLRNREGL